MQIYERFADGSTCYNTSATIVLTDGGMDAAGSCAAAKGGCTFAYSYLDYYPANSSSSTSNSSDSDPATDAGVAPALVGFKGVSLGPFRPGPPNTAKVRASWPLAAERPRLHMPLHNV